MVIEKPPGAEPASILDLLASRPHQSTPQENKVEAFLKACLKFSSQEIKLKSTPLTWWKNNCATYPTLAQMARAYLGCSGSSCAVERLFSAASDVCSSRQGGLLPSTMSHCVSSLMWLRDTAKKNPSGGLVRHGIGHDCPMLCRTSLSDRLFDPMSDNICPMSFYSSDRLFDSFESVAEQASDEFSWRAGHWPALRAQFASRSLACSRTQFAEQASDLHRELSSPSRPVTCSRTQFAEQVIGLLANSVRRAGQ
ncbi:hypothetical protein PCANC_08004 [Puccinia coronata f. sp. avenae]|uniref:HAT C-terminal dimerisation domain-containing protein n=1 Tax=Puccinia coronata f. sp. avenae TaxID=200324 RepID=A0A2N5SWC2_9BASI|nr:hypothetical protein PCANC_08004 [Puccinia coronata f. sp. avenae]